MRGYHIPTHCGYDRVLWKAEIVDSPASFSLSQATERQSGRAVTPCIGSY